MSPLPPPDQTVAIAFLVALFYGLYLSTFFHCMRWLLFTNDGWELRGRKSIQWPKLVATFAIFSMSTLDRGIQLKRWTDQAMWYLSPAHSQVHTADWTDVVLVRLNVCLLYLASPNLMHKVHHWQSYNSTGRCCPSELMRPSPPSGYFALIIVQISRLWNIYTKSYRVIAFPVILWFGGFMLTALQAYVQIAQVSKLNVWLPVNMSIGPGIILTPFWASTIVLNIFATCKQLSQECLEV